ncbi:MAG: NifB/NifX family molybdenum-iron cluster-binding protein [Thermodesulfobacteriota bacterium]
MSRIAVSSEGPHLESQVDPRFGRAAGFVIVDPDTMSYEYLDNGATQTMSQGAGIQAAETVVRAGIKTVLTGFVGPKAFQALRAARVEIGQNLHGLTVREAIERFNKGQIEFASQPNPMGRG